LASAPAGAARAGRRGGAAGLRAPGGRRGPPAPPLPEEDEAGEIRAAVSPRPLGIVFEHPGHHRIPGLLDSSGVGYGVPSTEYGKSVLGHRPGPTRALGTLYSVCRRRCSSRTGSGASSCRNPTGGAGAGLSISSSADIVMAMALALAG